LLGDALAGAAPVLHIEGSYRLNLEVGISVDVRCLELLAGAAAERASLGDIAAAASAYERAANLYKGDLLVLGDIHAVVERERLRVLYLSSLAWLAQHAFDIGDYARCLARALAVLASEPTREDAHRLVMRCYVRRGERAQAMRQYRLCQIILRDEFDTCPEPATQLLFEQIRTDPAGI
jgi:DNA-binding SARP family transcriptional activator